MDAEGASSSKSPREYDVFLSFRGEDTRTSFTDHLYTTLWRAGIITYRDDEELDRGQVIKEELLAAIENSRCAIVILSQNYASSTWCLDELLKILESRKKLGTQVLPIFYGVDPSDVRNQRASFAEAFRKHSNKFRENKVQKWRQALEEVANLSGWDTKNRHETKLIEEVVAAVWTNLQPKFRSYIEGLVGIGSKIQDIYSCLRLELAGVRFIGIWGMGGIGKTTLARVVFKKMETQFDISCFLENIREISGERGLGLVDLQRKLLSHLNLKNLKIESLDDGRSKIEKLLCHKKVLLVLDDVSDESQLENLVGKMNWFGSGSRVILTTRDKHLLTSNKISETYCLKILEEDESLQLLWQNAFESNQPPEQFLELSKQVVQYAGGLPLALKVLGSFLRGRNQSQWEQILFKIEKVPKDEKIRKTLKISYDGLESEYQTIFLDIACFFKGWSKHRVIEILENCDRYTPIGIDILVERSLITCDDSGKLGMHDLLQELGRSVVFEQSPIDAGKRSRLWSIEDIDQVLKHNKGSDFIEGISLESPIELYDAHWHLEAFSKISNLKLLLILRDLQLPLGLKYLSNSLKVLEWKGYPLKDLPLGQLDAIVDLKMHHSKIKKLWSGNHFFGKLKFIDLSHSKDLIETPTVSEAPNLERLVLDGCIKLVKVHPSIGKHKNLILLNLKDCISLKSLPSKLEMSCLKYFILSGCSEIKKLPDFGENMKYLSELDLKDCKSLVCIPESICKLISLRIVNIAGCLKVCKLPCNMDQNVALEELDVSGTAIREITSSNICLENLKRLSFGGCKELSSNSWDLSLPFGWVWKFWKQPVAVGLTLPPLSRLSSLLELDLSYCNLSDGSIPNDLGCLRSLCRLNLSGNSFANLPANCIANNPSLNELGLMDCSRLQSMPVLPPGLNIYNAVGCAQMEQSVLGLQKFWKLLESMEDWSKIFSNSFFLILGNEIPLWFDNQKHFHYRKPSGESRMSVIVDIPDHCYSSDWWGIALCLALKPGDGMTVFKTKVFLMCELLNYPNSRINKAHNGSFLLFKRKNYLPAFSYDHLFVEFLRVDNEYIHQCLQGRQGQIQCVLGESMGGEISKVGCRVLCKEDVEEGRKAMMTEVEMLSNSKQSLKGVNKSTVTITEIANDKRGRDEFERLEDGANANIADEANAPHSKRRKLE